VQYRAQPLDAGRRASTLTNARLASRRWTVSALTSEALRRNPELALARAQYQSARAAITTAGERPNPTVALSPQIVTPFTQWIAGTYGVDFDWTIETGAKRSSRLAAARHAANAAAANVITAEWKVRAAVRRAMLELYGAQRREKLLVAASARQAEVQELITERIAAGAASSLETAQPRHLSAQLQLQNRDAEKLSALARGALAEALGMSVNGLTGATFSFDAFTKASGPKQLGRGRALTQRGDILAALSEYAAADSNLRLELAKQYPDVHVNPGYQLDAGENKWSLGLSLTLPILNQNKGPIREAVAKRQEASARFDVVQARSIAEIDRALASIRAARAKLVTVDQLRAAQEQQMQSLERLSAAGETDKLAVSTAAVERATTEIARSDAEVELQAALGAWQEATQTRLDP
jgi:outer membrane protein TolC